MVQHNNNKLLNLGIPVIISILFWIIEPVGIDTPFHLLRIGELAKEITRSFPVYIYRDVYNHFGYPIPIFYCSFFLYPFAGLVLAGFSAISSYKIMVISIMWLTYLSAYLCIRLIPGYREVSHDAALIYTLQPLFLSELYFRGAIGAACVFIFIPMVLLGVYYIILSSGIWYDRDDIGKTFSEDTVDVRRQLIFGIICLSAGMSGIVMSHVISAVLVVLALLVLFIAVIFSMIRLDNSIKHIIYMVLSVCASTFLCLLMTAWYTVPMAEQLLKYRYKSQSVVGLDQITENLFAMLIPCHLSTALKAVLHREIPQSAIGGAVVLMLMVTVYLIASGVIRRLFRRERILLVLYYLLSFSLTIPVIWNTFGKLLGFMQFSWRIYLIPSVISVIFQLMLYKRIDTGNFRKVIKNINIISAVYVLVFLFAYFSVRNIMPDFIEKYAGHEIERLEYSSETEDILYIPYMMDPNEIRKADRIVSCDSDSLIYDYDIDEVSGTIYCDIVQNGTEESVITFPFIMYDGYNAVNEDNGNKYTVDQGENGLVQVIIPQGETGKIRVSYTGTSLQKISFVLSLCIWLLLIIFPIVLKVSFDGHEKFSI